VTTQFWTVGAAGRATVVTDCHAQLPGKITIFRNRLEDPFSDDREGRLGARIGHSRLVMREYIPNLPARLSVD